MSAETVRNHYRRQGAEQREKEIIVLLEAERDRNWMTAAPFVRHIVALIKGEVK